MEHAVFFCVLLPPGVAGGRRPAAPRGRRLCPVQHGTQKVMTMAYIGRLRQHVRTGGFRFSGEAFHQFSFLAGRKISLFSLLQLGEKFSQFSCLSCERLSLGNKAC